MIGEPRIDVDECESTQLLLGTDDPEGAVAVADHQTAGRGRLGRSWIAPPGTGITVSVLLRPPRDSRIAQVSLVGGLAAAEAVEEELGFWRSSQIKWPNDVMVNRRKVAGVLAEARDGAVVLGIGINVNQTLDELPRDVRQPVASLRTIDGREHDRAALLTDLLARLDRFYGAWREGGLEAVFHDLGSRDFLRGRRVSVDDTVGTAIGITRSGALEVEFDGERRLIEGGEVAYER
ncbi:MAG TPA: biotin--[acetyl-CoA-carboxylase] ligase [Gaiellaceae bacterium]|nr:biotin--[acetyl-CoA-carboxylase] ligase [Gaiellaceae bacterium]